MKILFLLPPSEGKNHGWDISEEKLSLSFTKPYDIAVNATEKDLKCIGKRYEEGIRLNKIRNYDIVILDLGLPDKPGSCFIESRNNIKPDVPILVLTGDAEAEMDIQNIMRAWDGFMPKPFDRSQLIIKIHTIVGSSINNPPEKIAAR